MAIPGPLRPAEWVDRPNRFMVRARLEAEQEVVQAHLPDPGRLREFARPGTRLFLREAQDPRRSTRWTAVLAARDPHLVSLDTTLPNPLVRKALETEALEELAGFSLDRAEVTVGRHRYDFRLEDDFQNGMLLEVKGVNWCVDGAGRFPDAPTERGTRQVQGLAAHVANGGAAALLFVCQRSDVHRVEPAPEVDPGFSEALQAAHRAGVRVFARRCVVTLEEMALGQAVPVTGLRGTV